MGKEIDCDDDGTKKEQFKKALHGSFSLRDFPSPFLSSF